MELESGILSCSIPTHDFDAVIGNKAVFQSRPFYFQRFSARGLAQRHEYTGHLGFSSMHQSQFGGAVMCPTRLR